MKFANCTTPDHHRNISPKVAAAQCSLSLSSQSAVRITNAKLCPHYSRCRDVGMLGCWDVGMSGTGVVVVRQGGSCPWVKALLYGPSYGVCQSRWAGKKNLSSSHCPVVQVLGSCRAFEGQRESPR